MQKDSCSIDKWPFGAHNGRVGHTFGKRAQTALHAGAFRPRKKGMSPAAYGRGHPNSRYTDCFLEVVVGCRVDDVPDACILIAHRRRIGGVISHCRGVRKHHSNRRVHIIHRVDGVAIIA